MHSTYHWVLFVLNFRSAQRFADGHLSSMSSLKESTSKSSPDVAELGLTGNGDSSESEKRLNELGYKSEFRRDMSLFGVLGISFCAIGILTGMSSAFQTGLFSGGPLGLFWGWNVSASCFVRRVQRPHIRHFFRSVVCLCCSLLCRLRKFAARCK